MASKAERKRRKRVVVMKGAPMRAGVDRYANGRIVNRDRQPAETAEDAMATVRSQPHRRPLAASGKRQSIAGVDVETLMGSSLGRLLWQDHIREHQYEAGMRFAKDMARDRATIGLPPCTTQAILYGDKRGGGYDATSKEAQEASERMTTLRLVLIACGEECRGDVVRPGIVVRQVALEERDNESLSEHEVGALRMGLNALARYYKIEISGQHRQAA